MAKSKDSGTWRNVSVPPSLRGKKVTNQDVREWARKHLNGEEPDLNNAQLKAIREGQVRNILLKPKKKGFFLPGVGFVEAFDQSVEFGGDLDAAEAEMDKEEEDWRWIDAESKLFNKRVAGESNIRALWEHGKRVEEYVKTHDRKHYPFHKKLEERGGPHGYGLRTHQVATELYRWRPTAEPDEPYFDWTWQLVDAFLKFSTERDVRDALLAFLVKELLDGGARQSDVAFFLRGPDEEAPIWKRDRVFLTDIRDRLKRGDCSMSDREGTRLRSQFIL